VFRNALITLSLFLAAGCGVGANPSSRGVTSAQALTGTAEWLEFEPAQVRLDLFREVARQSNVQAGSRGAVLFPLLVGAEFIAAPALDPSADLLGPGDAGAPIDLTFETRGDRFAEDRRDAFQGLSEREAAEQIARSLLILWNIRPTGPVTVVRTPGAPYAAAWIDGGRIRMYGHAPDVVNEYRRAVDAAEHEGQKTGHSALDQPGLALPSRELSADRPLLGSISAVRIKDGKGAALQAFLPDAPLSIEIDWALREKSKVRFGLDLVSADGRLLFSTGWDGGELAGTGTARLELSRLGLGGGVYELLLWAAGNGETVKNPFRLSLHVVPTDGVGLLRPELRWSCVK